jgi:hypothetical protein
MAAWNFVPSDCITTRTRKQRFASSPFPTFREHREGARASHFHAHREVFSTPSAQEIGAMRNMMIRTSFGVFALLLSLSVSAKATINYSADQAASCPPANSSQEDPTAAETETTDQQPAPVRSGTTPIKSGRGTRLKWKALLPGTIK